MNEQRRKELVKVVHKLAEDGKIAVRHARTHARDALKKLSGVSRGRREARREGPAEGARRLHRQDRRADQGERSRDHGSLTRPSSSADAARIALRRRRGAGRDLDRARTADAPLAALLASCRALGAWEFFRIARASGLTPLDDVGIALAGTRFRCSSTRATSACTIPRPARATVARRVVLLALLALAIWLRGVDGQAARRRRRRPRSASRTPAGCSASATPSAITTTRSRRRRCRSAARTYSLASGGLLLLLPVFVTWASDIGAYSVGRTIGKHKLIPSVSPGKTVAGAVGGLAGEHARRVAVRALRARSGAHLGFHAGGVLAVRRARERRGADRRSRRVAAQARGGVKDSSHIIPGHGGVLDRFDSLLFVLPVAYVAARLAARRGRRDDDASRRRAASRSSARPARSGRRRCACSRASASAFASPRSPRSATPRCSSEQAAQFRSGVRRARAQRREPHAGWSVGPRVPRRGGARATTSTSCSTPSSARRDSTRRSPRSRAGKRVALANKETLVMAGALVTAACARGRRRARSGRQRAQRDPAVHHRAARASTCAA